MKNNETLIEGSSSNPHANLSATPKAMRIPESRYIYGYPQAVEKDVRKWSDGEIFKYWELSKEDCIHKRHEGGIVFYGATAATLAKVLKEMTRRAKLKLKGETK